MGKHVTLLLQTIDCKADVSALREVGLEYSQIVDLIKYCQAQGYCEYIDRSLALTSSGKALMVEAKKRRIKGGPSLWISELDGVRVESMNLWEVYLPKRSPINRGHGRTV